MDETLGYNQTTKGATLAIRHNYLLLDMEGSDSKERDLAGERSFENRAALFALAVSDVLLINIWTNELGRASGACKDLLRVVIENFLPLIAGKE